MTGQTASIIAIAAGAIALAALGVALAATRSLRTQRTAQQILLGDGDPHDLIARAAELAQSLAALRAYVESLAAQLDGQLKDTDSRLQRAIAHRSLVRYDAYNEMSGHQSLSIALLDEAGSGVVLSSIHHRDQARLYAKLLHEGHSELELSPEEDEAVRRALQGE